MQKKVDMKLSVLIWATLKPSLRRKFGLKEIHKCRFVANVIEDELELMAVGLDKDSNQSGGKALPMKLSDHSFTIDILLEKVKEKVEFEKLSCVYTNIDFIKNTIISDIFYTRKSDGMKDSAKIELKF